SFDEFCRTCPAGLRVEQQRVDSSMFTEHLDRSLRVRGGIEGASPFLDSRSQLVILVPEQQSVQFGDWWDTEKAVDQGRPELGALALLAESDKPAFAQPTNTSGPLYVVPGARVQVVKHDRKRLGSAKYF